MFVTIFKDTQMTDKSFDDIDFGIRGNDHDEELEETVADEDAIEYPRLNDSSKTTS